ADAAGTGMDRRMIDGGADLDGDLVPAEPAAIALALRGNSERAGDRVDHGIVLGLQRYPGGGNVGIADGRQDLPGIVAGEDLLVGRDDVDGDGERRRRAAGLRAADDAKR